LDEGIGDTFVSVGATIWLQTAVSINSAGSAPIPRAIHPLPALRGVSPTWRVQNMLNHDSGFCDAPKERTQESLHPFFKTAI